MYTTRMIDDKEKDRYMNFIKYHPRGHFQQSFEWGEVQRSIGWTPLPLILEKDGEIQAALLILKKRLPIPLINKCIFYAPGGPVVDLESEEMCQVLFAGAEKVASDHGAVFLKIDPEIKDPNVSMKDTLQKCGFKKQPTVVHLERTQLVFLCRLDITPSEIKLMENMNIETRQHVKLTSKKELIIREASAKEELTECYAMLQASSSRKPFLCSYKSFETLWDEMVERGMATIFIAEYCGQVISSSLVFRLGENAWCLYGFSLSGQEDPAVKPNDMMQWEIIKWAREQGCKQCDFRCVSEDSDKGNSLPERRVLKNGFNGVLMEPVGDWDAVYSGFYYFLWQHLLPLPMRLTRKWLRKKVSGGT